MILRKFENRKKLKIYDSGRENNPLLRRPGHDLDQGHDPDCPTVLCS